MGNYTDIHVLIKIVLPWDKTQIRQQQHKQKCTRCLLVAVQDTDDAQEFESRTQKFKLTALPPIADFSTCCQILQTSMDITIY